MVPRRRIHLLSSLDDTDRSPASSDCSNQVCVVSAALYTIFHGIHCNHNTEAATRALVGDLRPALRCDGHWHAHQAISRARSDSNAVRHEVATISICYVRCQILYHQPRPPASLVQTPYRLTIFRTRSKSTPTAQSK